MLMRIFVALVILTAVAVGLYALVLSALGLPRDQLVKLIIFRDFFDITLPILAFGALVKYLCTCTVKCKVTQETESK